MELFYDPNCPVCLSFQKKITKSLPELKCTPDPTAQEFRIHHQGKNYFAKEAVTLLSEAHPVVLDSFWILPPHYRKKAALVTYSWATKWRKWFKKDCNCH